VTEIVDTNLHNAYCSNVKPARVRQLTRRAKTRAGVSFETMQKCGQVIIQIDDAGDYFAQPGKPSLSRGVLPPSSIWHFTIGEIPIG
jgi:hypothetical protein